MVRLGGSDGRKSCGSPSPDLSYSGPMTTTTTGAPASLSSSSNVIPMITSDLPSGGGWGAGGVVDRTTTNSSSRGNPSCRVALGVSALFRRGPLPIPPDNVGAVAGGRDPTGVHATREGRIRSALTSSGGGGVVVVHRHGNHPNNPTIDRIRDGLITGGSGGRALSLRQQQRQQRPPSAAVSEGGGTLYLTANTRLWPADCIFIVVVEPLHDNDAWIVLNNDKGGESLLLLLFMLLGIYGSPRL